MRDCGKRNGNWSKYDNLDVPGGGLRGPAIKNQFFEGKAFLLPQNHSQMASICLQRVSVSKYMKMLYFAIFCLKSLKIHSSVNFECIVMLCLFFLFFLVSESDLMQFFCYLLMLNLNSDSILLWCNEKLCCFCIFLHFFWFWKIWPWYLNKIWSYWLSLCGLG